MAQGSITSVGNFAHEFHHHRCRHLGLHAAEAERAADTWATQHANSKGYTVTITGPPSSSLDQRDAITNRKAVGTIHIHADGPSG